MQVATSQPQFGMWDGLAAGDVMNKVSGRRPLNTDAPL
jgi:hypothetical protein